jgi:hypothetical protein
MVEYMGRLRWRLAFGVESLDSLDGYRGWRIPCIVRTKVKDLGNKVVLDFELDREESRE